MADQEKVRQENEENLNTPEPPEVTELDDQSLEEASGGFQEEESILDNNGNCLC